MRRRKLQVDEFLGTINRIDGRWFVLVKQWLGPMQPGEEWRTIPAQHIFDLEVLSHRLNEAHFYAGSIRWGSRRGMFIAGRNKPLLSSEGKHLVSFMRQHYGSYHEHCIHWEWNA